MLDLREYRGRPALLADFLPWAALVAPGVVLNKDGSFQRTARFRGADLDSSTPSGLMAAAARLNGVLRRLGSGWAIFVEAARTAAVAYPDSDFPDDASQLVEDERRAQFEEAGAHFESACYLTFLFLPPAERSAGIERWLFDGAGDRGVDWREVLAGFIDRTDRMLGLLESCFAEAGWLDDAQTLTYLHSTVSGRAQRVAVPSTPMCLDAVLADEPLRAGLAPRLGDAHLRVLTVSGFPAETWPGILDELNRLAFPYRWSTRAICLDRTASAAVLGRIRRQWFAKRRSVAAIVKEVLTNEASALVDTDAENKALDADAALQDQGADLVGYAYVTATLVVLAPDAATADARLRLAEKVIQSRDFTCRPETLNAVEAWLGSLPGQAYANVRQPPVSTLNLAHMIPLSAVWPGPAENRHLGGPPLFHGRTDGSTPFRFCSHDGDVGHTLVVGPTGSGKSVLLALMALQFRRYEGAQVFAFDFGGSVRAAVLAMGGDFFDLGGLIDPQSHAAVSLQPLAGLDEPAQRIWAQAWLLGVLAGEGVSLTPEVRDHVWSALLSLSSAPRPERTLSGFAALLQSAALKQALLPFVTGGPWGRLLDADSDRTGSADVQAFETEGLIGKPGAAAVLSCLFHRIELRLTGRPALIIVDEGWLVLDDPLFGAQLREWLKTLRKKNAAVVFATQSLADIEASAIAPAIIESCPTRVFLPNDRALEPASAVTYRRFGLNGRQLEILATAYPRRDYYCQSRSGNRLFELDLGPVAFAFCAASAKADQAAITETLALSGAGAFAPAWLRRRGLPWAADLIDPPLHPSSEAGSPS